MLRCARLETALKEEQQDHEVQLRHVRQTHRSDKHTAGATNTIILSKQNIIDRHLTNILMPVKQNNIVKYYYT
jgi:hypothetical protein